MGSNLRTAWWILWIASGPWRFAEGTENGSYCSLNRTINVTRKSDCSLENPKSFNVNLQLAGQERGFVQDKLWEKLKKFVIDPLEQRDHANVTTVLCVDMNDKFHLSSKIRKEVRLVAVFRHSTFDGKLNLTKKIRGPSPSAVIQRERIASCFRDVEAHIRTTSPFTHFFR